MDPNAQKSTTAVFVEQMLGAIAAPCGLYLFYALQDSDSWARRRVDDGLELVERIRHSANERWIHYSVNRITKSKER